MACKRKSGGEEEAVVEYDASKALKMEEVTSSSSSSSSTWVPPESTMRQKLNTMDLIHRLTRRGPSATDALKWLQRDSATGAFTDFDVFCANEAGLTPLLAINRLDPRPEVDRLAPQLIFWELIERAKAAAPAAWPTGTLCHRFPGVKHLLHQRHHETGESVLEHFTRAEPQLLGLTLVCGVDVNLRGSNNKPYLQWLLCEATPCWAYAFQLIRMGADVNATWNFPLPSSYTQVALHHAFAYYPVGDDKEAEDQADVLCLDLIRSPGVDLNSYTIRGRTALILAVTHGATKLVKELLHHVPSGRCQFNLVCLDAADPITAMQALRYTPIGDDDLNNEKRCIETLLHQGAATWSAYQRRARSLATENLPFLVQELLDMVFGYCLWENEIPTAPPMYT